MDRRPARPLTPAEAKTRLRRAAGEVGFVPWVRRHPVPALLVGATAGFLFGAMPRQTRQDLWRGLLRWIGRSDFFRHLP